MKEPIYWKAAESDGTEKVPRSSTLPGWLEVTACILFLIISFLIWLSVESTFCKIVYYVLLLLPNYACGEYLGSKIFSKKSGLRIANSGFSLRRILLGVFFVFGFFGLVYGITLIMRRLLSA
jgi:hypothetical protein